MAGGGRWMGCGGMGLEEEVGEGVRGRGTNWDGRVYFVITVLQSGRLICLSAACIHGKTVGSL